MWLDPYCCDGLPAPTGGVSFHMMGCYESNVTERVLLTVTRALLAILCSISSCWRVFPLWSLCEPLLHRQLASFQHRPTSLRSIAQAASLSMTSWQKITCDHFGVHAGSSLTEILSLITTWGYLPQLCWNRSVTEALMAGTQEYSRFPSRWVKETIEGPCRLFNGPSFKDIIEAFVRALDSEASRSQKALSGSVSLASPVDNHRFNVRTFFFFKRIHGSCTFNVLPSCSCSGCS